MPTHGQDSAPFAADRIAPGRAALKHAHVAEGEIVFHRVRRVEPAHRGRDFLGGFPRDVRPIGEAEVSTELVDMRVDGHEEPFGRHLPEAQIHAVGGARHPAEKEHQALDRASLSGIGEDMRGSPAFSRRLEGSLAPDPRDPCGERRAKVGGARKLGGEGGAEGSGGPLDVSSADHEARKVAIAVDAVPEAFKARHYIGGIVGREGDAWAEAREGVFDFRAQGFYVSERERGGDERDDLLVFEGLIAMDEFDGIGRAPRLDIALRPDVFEGLPDGLVAPAGRSVFSASLIPRRSAHGRAYSTPCRVRPPIFLKWSTNPVRLVIAPVDRRARARRRRDN